MSFPTIETEEIAAIVPPKTVRGRSRHVKDVVHLPDERWRDGVDKVRVVTIAFSPNGSTVASGSDGGTVRLWDVKTGKVIAKWTKHTESVLSVCWSADNDRVMSGSLDGTARIFDVKSGETVLDPVLTKNLWVSAVVYSPDSTKFAMGGSSRVQIWDGKTGELLTTLEHDHWVKSLAWT